MAASTISEYTNDRDYRAVVRYLFELLHTPQLYHQRAVQRIRLEWLTREVIAIDATNLELTRSVVVSDRFVEDGDESYVIDTNEGGSGTILPRVLVESTSIRLEQPSPTAKPTAQRFTVG